MSLIKLSATKAFEMMKKGELSSEQYVSNFLEHIEKKEIFGDLLQEPSLEIESLSYSQLLPLPFSGPLNGNIFNLLSQKLIFFQIIILKTYNIEISQRNLGKKEIA